MRVIILSSSALHKMHFTDLYINEIREQYPVDLWDVSEIYHHPGKDSEFPEVLKIHSPEELQEKVQEAAKADHCVCLTNILIFDLHVVYPVFHRAGIPLLQIDKESMIWWMRDAWYREHQEHADDATKKMLRFKDNPVTRPFYSWLEYQHVKFDYLLGAKNYYPDQAKHFIPIHSLKYDEYLRSTQEEPVLSEKYILFMDAGLAHLPAVSGQPNSIDRDDYLICMNRLFDQLEERYHLPVVIAAHPKSEYPENAFRGRQAILYKTAALARYAEFVLCHYSTSIIDLVLQRKPIVFMTSRDYMKSASKTILITTAEYARLLHAPLLELHEEKLPGSLAVQVEEAAYDAFTREHIIGQAPAGKNNRELILEFLKTLEK